MKPIQSNISAVMESKLLHKKIVASLLSLLAISAVFLLFISLPSNPFIIMSKDEALNQKPPPSRANTTTNSSTTTNLTMSNPSSLYPFNIIPKRAQNQSEPPSELNTTITRAPSSLSPPGMPRKEALNQSHPHSDLTDTAMPSKDSKSIPQNTSLTSDGNKEKCNLFEGKWVRESRGSIYTNLTCGTLPESKNCGKFGKDQEYVYWRWKPDGCEIPRFDPFMFLNTVRGKKLAFIGDSLSRNHMESLLCLLSQAETPTDIYKDVFEKFRTWYFRSHDFTLMVFWTQFLVESTEVFLNGTATGSFDLQIDKINSVWGDKLHGLNYAVISGGNWFFRRNYLYEGGKLIGCTLCDDVNLTRVTMESLVQRVFRTVLQYINECAECQGMVTLLRTFSPSHFEHGGWFDGGYCNRTQPLQESEVSSSDSILDIMRRIQLEELATAREQAREQKTRFELLDISRAMLARADAHPGSHYPGKTTPKSSNDCLHWCLPGPVDMWNDLLLEVLKRESLF